MRVSFPCLVAAVVLAGCTGSATSDEAVSTTEVETTTTLGTTSSTATADETTDTTDDDAAADAEDDTDAESGDEATAEQPGVVWIIDGDTFDAVAVDVESGDEVDRVPGWGPEFAGGGDETDEELDGLFQALQTIDVVPAESGITVWLDDCCEPAFGSAFGVDPDVASSATSIIDAASVTLMGLGPAVSADGTLVAVGIGDLGVTVAEAATGITVVDLTDLATTLVGDDEFVTWQTLAWSADRVLAVAASGAEGSTLHLVDLRDPEAPEVVASAPLEGTALDATSGGDGTIVVLVRSDDGVEAVVLDAAGERVGGFPTLPGSIHLDGSPDGSRFLVVDGAGDVVVQTLDGGLETLDLGGRTAIDAAWG